MTAREIIEEAQLLIGDPEVDFHNRDRMLFALNRTTNRISVRSRSIHESIYRSVVANQYEYALPEGTLFIRKAKYNDGQWRDLGRGSFDYVEARAAYNGGAPPRSFSLWQNARVEKFVGTVYAVDNDASRARNLIRQFTIPLVVDDFTLLPNDIIINLSKGHGESTIFQLLIDTHPDFPDNVYKIAHPALTGGTSDRFDEGDEVRIVSPHTKGHSLLVAPSPVRTDEVGTESLAAFVARRHRVITADHMDSENDNLELDEEFNDTLMYEMLHWARVQQSGLDTTARLYRRLSNEEYLTAIPKVENRIHQNLNAWERRVGGGSVYRDVDVKPSGGAGFNGVVVA